MVFLIRIPTDPKNIWVLGISKNRFLLSLGMAVIVVCFLVFTLISYRKQNQLQLSSIESRLSKWIMEYGWYIPFMFLAFSAVVFGPYFYLLKRSINLPTLQAILIRIAPFILLGCSQALLAVIASTALYWHKRPRGSDQIEDKVIIAVNPRKVMVILITIGLLLISASISMNVAEQVVSQQINFFGEKFDLDLESNIPTAFSSLLLLIASVLSWLVAKNPPSGNKIKSHKNHWIALSVLFLYLSLDEVAVFHEYGDALVGDGALYERGWVLAALPFLFLFVVFYTRFFLHLPTEMKLHLLLAAILYLGGAIGFELLTGWYEQIYNVDRFPIYLTLTTTEEALEIVGILIYIYALLKYLNACSNEIVFKMNKQIS